MSWYPPGAADDEGDDLYSVLPTILDHAEKYSLKVRGSTTWLRCFVHLIHWSIPRINVLCGGLVVSKLDCQLRASGSNPGQGRYLVQDFCST